MTEPVLDPKAYRAALAAFREVIDGPRVGVSTIPEIEQLRILVRRYPDEARRVLEEAGSGGEMDRASGGVISTAAAAEPGGE